MSSNNSRATLRGCFTVASDQNAQVSYKPNAVTNDLVTTEIFFFFLAFKLLDDQSKEM
jgi:hypothetical protein